MSETISLAYILENIINGLLLILNNIIQAVFSTSQNNVRQSQPQPQINGDRVKVEHIEEVKEPQPKAFAFFMRKRVIIQQESYPQTTRRLLPSSAYTEKPTTTTTSTPTQTVEPPPPKTTTAETTKVATKKVPIYQRGDLHPSKWIYITDVEIPNCPPQVTSLYYERPDEGNRLLSVNGEPSDYHPKGIVKGSAGLDYSFLQKINYGDWWCETKEEEFKYVPVYQRGGHHPSKWIFKENVPIKKEYKDIIHSLYYARSNEGNELLSVNGEPDFYHLGGRQVYGSARLPREYLNRMSQFGWWRY